MARPSKLSPEVEKAVCDNIRLGLTYRASAEAAGIGYDAFNRWMNDPRPRFRKFNESVEKANGEARKILMTRIQQSAKDGEWRAAAWTLERRFPDEYGPKLDVTSKGEAIVVRLVKDDES
jgi:transposase